MSPLVNPKALEQLTTAIGLMTQGCLLDARDSLVRAGTDESQELQGLTSALTILLERLAESLASKETAMATLQFSLLELESTQEELRRNEARYRELFSSMNDGVVVFHETGDDNFTVEDINTSSLRIERLERDQAMGRTVTDLWPSVGEVGLLDALRRVHHSGASEHLAPRIYRDARVEGWREYFLYRLPTAEVVLVYRDVSAQKATEQALRSSLSSTEQLIDSAPIGLVVVGGNETIRRANNVAAGILGSEPTRLVGQHWRKFATDRSKDHRRMWREESSLLDVNGASISVLISEIPVKLNGEDVVRIEAFLDLTDRKQLETQLRHAQKLEAVGQLAAGIAHEINTPAQFVGDNLSFLGGAFKALCRLVDSYRVALATLPASTGQAELVEELKKAEEEADLKFIEEQVPAALEEAREGISRISTIVGAMKQFASPDHREKRPADLNRALQATLAIARSEYKHVAEIETDFGDLPLVPCYVSDLNQVFLNLLVNAAHTITDSVQGTHAAGRIRVRTACVGNDRVRIDVADTGCGIPPEIRERVFDPFFTTKDVGRGTGQGLAIARSIVVDKHQGSLTFESEPGRGTTFTILLPVDGSPTKDDGTA